MAQAPNPDDREAAQPASSKPSAQPRAKASAPRMAPKPARAAAAPRDAAPAASRTLRAETVRSASLRPPMGGGATEGQLYIDPGLLPKGMEFQWVREECASRYDMGNVQLNLEQRGFEAVTTDEFPELAPKFLPGRAPEGNLIRRGGLVLMARPAAVAKAENDRRKASDAATLRAVNKELAAGADGKVVQELPGAAVTVAVDRGDGTSPNQRFSDA